MALPLLEYPSVPDNDKLYVYFQYILHLKNPDGDNIKGFTSKVLMPIIFSIDNYEKTKEIVKNNIQQMIKEYVIIIAQELKQNESSFSLLQDYSVKWTKFKIIKICIDTSLKPIFKLELLSKVDKIINSFCNNIWVECVFEQNKLVIRSALHELLDEFRKQSLDGYTDQSNITIIHQVINSYIEIDKSLTKEYITDWVEPLLEHTKEYYAKICSEYFSNNNSISEYLNYCDRILDLEDLIARKFLHQQSIKEHSNVVNEVVIINYKDRLSEGLADFVTDNKIVELKHLYRLFNRINNLDPLIQLFFNHCNVILMDLFVQLVPQFEDQANKQTFPITFCKEFLDKYNFLLKIIDTAFNNDNKFKQMLDKSARTILNNNSIIKQDDQMELCARFIARYTDYIISDSKISIQEIVDNHINNLNVLYVLLASKDVFCKCYKTYFMNRLLKTKIIQDSDICFINMMKKCDIELTQSLSIMIRDINQSNERYNNIIESTNIQFVPTIITASSWPLNNHELGIIMKLPKEIEDLSTVFIKKFSDINNGKVVVWLHEKSMIELSIKFSSKTYRITMNHLQAAITLALAKNSIMTNNEIYDATELTPEWADSALKSLGSVKLFQQNPKTKAWRINPGFSAPSIVLNASVKFTRPVAEDKVDPQIEEQRCINTQAAIVRIMKTRRVIDHNSLCEEVIKQTSRFFPQRIERIKRQIEKLINGQEKYLERRDKNTYVYVTGSE